MADCLNNEQQIKSNLNSDSLTTNLDGTNNVSSEMGGENLLYSTMNLTDKTTSNLGAEEPIKSQLDLPTTNDYIGLETDNIVVTVDKERLTIEASLKQIKFRSFDDFPEIGSEKLIYIAANEKSLYAWDSTTASYYKLSSGGGGSGYDDTEIRESIANLETNKADKSEIPDDYLPDTTKYGANIDLTIDSTTYVITAQLKDQDGNNLGDAKTIDLPLESVVVSGSYDNATKKVVLTLKDGSNVEFSVADLVSGLQSEITDLDTIRSNASAGKSASDTIATYGNIVTHNENDYASNIVSSIKENSLIKGNYTLEISLLRPDGYRVGQKAEVDIPIGNSVIGVAYSQDAKSIIVGYKDGTQNTLRLDGLQSTIEEYLTNATVSNDTLKITKQDGSTVEFKGGVGGSKIIWEVWE